MNPDDMTTDDVKQALLALTPAERRAMIEKCFDALGFLPLAVAGVKAHITGQTTEAALAELKADFLAARLEGIPPGVSADMAIQRDIERGEQRKADGN